MEKKLFLLDAYALIFRAYYALINAPRFTSGGDNTSAIFGFVNTLVDVLQKERPSHLAVCFDPPGGSFRKQEYEGYKAERAATPEDIIKAVPVIKEILSAMHIAVKEVEGYEADDVIGTLARQARGHGFDTYMMTPDKDFGQLVTEGVSIYKPGYRGGSYEIRGVKEVCERYQLERPEQVIDLLALMGDKVDNIPGCPGVGEVTAIKLLKQFGTVEGLLANTDQLKGALRGKVEANAEQIRFSKHLATIITDVPVELDEEELRVKEPDAARLRDIFGRLEFRTLLRRILPAEAAAVPAAKPTAKERKRAAAAAQPSLFDFGDDTAEPVADQEPTATAVALGADYSEATDLAAIEALAARLQRATRIGFALACDGGNPINAAPFAFAFSDAEGKAVYVPLAQGTLGAALTALTPVFASPHILKISNDIKHAMIVLGRYGIAIAAPWADTAVMHYLLQPEQRHSADYLASTMLSLEALSDEEVLGKPGTKQRVAAPMADPELLRRYLCQQAELALRLEPALRRQVKATGVESLLDDVETPFTAVLADMERTGVKVDSAALAEISQVLEAQLRGLETEIYKLTGERFNVNSPAQVGEVLFGKLQLDPKAKRTASGQYSTSEEVLMNIYDRHPAVEKILKLRRLRKLLTTYVNALPELINPADGRIHTTYNQTVTATGRISSSNPNLQNIPVRTDDGREIRRAFVASPGNVFFSADYSQIELRIVAALSGDRTMIDSFRRGLDIHRATAAQIYGVKPEEVTDDQRRHAKTANFGILYGISAFGLAQRLHISRGEAKELIDNYRASFPSITRYMEQQIENARATGYVTTQFGRRRMLPDINSRNVVVRGFNERNAINAPIQGTAADIIKIAMVAIHRRFAEEGLRSKMIMQVHDELNFDVVPDELERVRAIVTEEMQGAWRSEVPLTASEGVGPTWLDAH